MIPERFAPMTYALFRIVFGLLFFLFGLQKTVGILGGPLARPFMSMMGAAGIIETVCGFLIMVGLFTKPAAFLASGEMAVAYFYIHTRLMGVAPLVNTGDHVLLCVSVHRYARRRHLERRQRHVIQTLATRGGRL